MATYYVSGDGANGNSPNGYYFEAGMYEAAPYYVRWDGLWTVWFDVPFYILSLALGLLGNYWSHFEGVRGTYNPSGTYTGNPVAAKVPDGAGNLLGVGR